MFGGILYSSDMQQYQCIHEAPSNKIARYIADRYTYLCRDNVLLSAFEYRVIQLDKLEQAIMDCKEKLNLKLAGMMKEDDDENDEEDGNEDTEEDDEEEGYDEYDEDDEEEGYDEYDEDDEEIEFKMPFHLSLNQMRLTRRSRFNQ